MFKYFTIGNLGQLSHKCAWSDFKNKFDPNDEVQEDITLDCGYGYISRLEEFGFLYKWDIAYNGFSEGQASCDHIENPRATYKYEEPPPIECDQFDGEELLLCEVD